MMKCTSSFAPAKPKQQSEDAERDEDEGCNQAPPRLPSGRLFEVPGLVIRPCYGLD